MGKAGLQAELNLGLFQETWGGFFSRAVAWAGLIYVGAGSSPLIKGIKLPSLVMDQIRTVCYLTGCNKRNDPSPS